MGEGSVLSHVTVSGQVIPDNVVLHGLKLQDGRFVVRIYGVQDNPKEPVFLGKDIRSFEEVFTNAERSLWTADIYPIRGTMEEAVAAALNVYEIAQGRGNKQTWRQAERTSLCTSFNQADTAAVLDWERHLRQTVKVEN